MSFLKILFLKLRHAHVFFKPVDVDILNEAKAYEIYLKHRLIVREQAISELYELPGTINTTKSQVEED